MCTKKGGRARRCVQMSIILYVSRDTNRSTDFAGNPPRARPPQFPDGAHSQNHHENMCYREQSLDYYSKYKDSLWISCENRGCSSGSKGDLQTLFFPRACWTLGDAYDTVMAADVHLTPYPNLSSVTSNINIPRFSALISWNRHSGLSLFLSHRSALRPPHLVGHITHNAFLPLLFPRCCVH